MTVALICLCGAKLKVRETDAGRAGKCPRCGRAVMVPVSKAVPRVTTALVCSGCSRGDPPGRNNPPGKDDIACSRCGMRGRSFTGEPGSVWRNETSRYRYQLTPIFRACCGVCLRSTHHIGPSWPIPFHEGCECKHRAIKPGDTSLPFLSLPALLGELTAAQQDAVMG